MTIPSESFDPGSVTGVEPRLCHRIDVGLGRALLRHRPGFSEDTDLTALSTAPELAKAYKIIPDLLSPVPGRVVEDQTVDTAIDTIVQILAEQPARLRAALYRPLVIVKVLEEEKHKRLSLNHQWFAWCWTSEAVWRALHLLPSKGSQNFLALTDTEIETLAPVAARQRFLALSEPYRGVRVKNESIPADASASLFGDQTSDILLARTRQARWEWAELLSRHESLPALEDAGPTEIETETDLLLFEFQVEGRGHIFGGHAPTLRKGPPLAINSKRLLDSNRVTRYSTEDIGFASWIVGRHLLPRYRIFATAHAAFFLAECSRWGRFMSALTVILAVLASVGALSSPWWELVPSTGWSTLNCAAVMAGVTYVVGLAGVILHGRAWTLPWLLRVPAAATIGMFMVTTMHPSWWGAAFAAGGMDVPGREDGPEPVAGPMVVAAILAAAAFAYLVTNVRTTGVDPFTSLARSALVLVIASVHALLIALLGLAWIVPVFSENGHLLREALTEYPQAAVAALLQAGAWCLIAGVFSQILWDDRPLTTPLTHAHWRSEQR